MLHLITQQLEYGKKYRKGGNMAEYMVINNNIIEAIYCGKADEKENVIILPENHEVRVGDNIAFYNNDWSRKSDVELMQLGLKDIPAGFKLENNMLVEMTYIEKVIAGIEEMPANMKIEEGKLLQKSQEELFNEMTLEQKEIFIRSKRDNLINEADILLIKYQEQVELGIITANETYRLGLLQYKQALRDIPEQKAFPENVEYPELPKYKDYE